MGLEINGLNTGQATTKQAKGSAQVASQDGEKKANSASTASGNTTVNISDEAKSLSQLQGKVTQGSSFDEGKVAELKAAVADGSYKPDANRIAGKLLDIDSQF